MKTTGNTGNGVLNYTINEISNAEMDKMIEARETLRANLINHASSNPTLSKEKGGYAIKESKKEYLNDDQLKNIFKILVALTKGCKHRQSTSFDEVDLDVELQTF